MGNKKNIAIVSGASSGMGRDFVLELDKQYAFDEIWVIARRKERLEELKQLVKAEVVVLAYDLTKKESFDEIQKLLEQENPHIKYLVNASGFGKFAASVDVSVQDQIDMVDLNVKAMMLLTHICLPFMGNGTNVIQIASQAAWQPIPYINVYAATKSFVLHYSRALNAELKNIHVMALCPFWTKTEFFNHAVNEDNKVIKKYTCLYDSKKVVKRALRDSKTKKDVSLYGFNSKLNVFLSKILPHRFVMWFWMKQQKLK